MGDLITTLQDMRHLNWSESYQTSGTSGTFLKANEGAGTGRVYYKLSCYDNYRGIFGHECVNELVASRLLGLMGIEHVGYKLIHALVEVDGKGYETWVSASSSYRHSTERKQAMDVFFRFNRQEGETPLDMCDRLGWGLHIRQMMLADYLIANRDRHGANIEVLRGEDGLQRLAPFFDNGLSFVFSCYKDEEKALKFDVMQDMPTNNYIGTKSLFENLAFLKGWDLKVEAVQDAWRSELFEGLDGVISAAHQEAMWNMISKRWRHYEAL